MKYVLLAVVSLVLCGCGKKIGKINGTYVEYSDSLFSDTLTVYMGERTYDIKYDELRTDNVKTEYMQETTSGSFSCSYAGMCFKYGKFGFHSFCNGRRDETRHYIYYDVDPKLNVIKNGLIVESIVGSKYKTNTYTTIKRGSCH